MRSHEQESVGKWLKMTGAPALQLCQLHAVDLTLFYAAFRLPLLPSLPSHLRWTPDFVYYILVTLSIAHLGSVKCFPESCYFSILLAWAECSSAKQPKGTCKEACNKTGDGQSHC